MNSWRCGIGYLPEKGRLSTPLTPDPLTQLGFFLTRVTSVASRLTMPGLITFSRPARLSLTGCNGGLPGSSWFWPWFGIQATPKYQSHGQSVFQQIPAATEYAMYSLGLLTFFRTVLLRKLRGDLGRRGPTKVRQRRNVFANLLATSLRTGPLTLLFDLVFSAHLQHPQSRHRRRQPQPLQPGTIGYAGTLHLPTFAFHSFVTLFDPGSQTIPARLRYIPRDVRYQQPRLFIAILIAGQQCAVQLALFVLEHRSFEGLAFAGWWTQILQFKPFGRTLRTIQALSADAQKRMPVQCFDATKQSGRVHASIGHNQYLPVFGHLRSEVGEHAFPMRFPGAWLAAFDNGPIDGHRAASVKDADIQNRKAIAKVGGIEGHDQLFVGPAVDNPTQETGSDGVGIPIGTVVPSPGRAVPLFGGRFLIPFLQSPADGKKLEGEPGRESQRYRMQRDRRCQDQPNAPQCQPLGLWTSEGKESAKQFVCPPIQRQATLRVGGGWHEIRSNRRAYYAVLPTLCQQPSSSRDLGGYRKS